LLTLLLSGCVAYQTPGAGVSMADLSKTDQDIAEVMKREPAALFPAHIAIARVESPSYQTRRAQCYGSGRLCVVLTHEVETDTDFERINGLPMVAGAAPIGGILLPSQIESVKDLRLAAANLKADLLLIYSIDTRFHVDTRDIGPLAAISLGFLQNKKARVTATASAALFDVRTGFVYGVAESSATEEQKANVWSTEDAIDASRVRAEKAAFQGLLTDYEKLWQRIVREHGKAKT
jgi:hypothetical protein